MPRNRELLSSNTEVGQNLEPIGGDATTSQELASESDNTATDHDSELVTKWRARQRELGATILAKAGFENRQKQVVESSFNKARKRGEKLPGKNNARRNFAYVKRLEDLVDKHGNALEKRLWRASANKLIIQPKDIPESYWHSQEQILRDNGQAREISDYEKQILTEDIQNHQCESLETWSNYLGDQQSPYPMWFKVYAWDGVSKMGVFDKDKKQFQKRDAHTVAPYPKLNPAVLAKVHGAITDFYGHTDKERYTEGAERDAELEALVKSGNFNKLYSATLLREKSILKTPERTEDIRGDWVEYLPGQEEQLATAAEGTPWCVADPGTGRNYLEYGNSEGDYEDKIGNSQAKFILFHLYDPKQGALSESACASIRLDTDGKVAEISGLNEGQALEDGLVPIVEAKVKTLPGGEEFLEKFADKKMLISLDRKMQAGEDLTKDELEFLYGIHRPIKTLDTYNDEDPRIDELKAKYNIEYALDSGIDTDSLVSRITPEEAIQNLDTLIAHGADIDIDNLVSRLSVWSWGIITLNLDTLIAHGANIDNLIPKLNPSYIASNLDTLISQGANIDNLVSWLLPPDITENLNVLITHNADIDNLVSKLGPYYVTINLDALIDRGANINIDDLMSKLNPEDIAEFSDTLIAHGADKDLINAKLDNA